MKIKKGINCLPLELLFEVLTCLSSKDLLKLRVVCKLWYSIICDRSFHQHHLHQLRKKNIQACNYYLSTNSSGYLSSVNIKSSETLATIEELKLRKSHHNGAINSIKGCVDGVLLAVNICFYNHFKNVIFLWNPTLRKVVDIPLYGSLKKIGWNVEFGFGFDSVTNIYKVVALHLQENDLEIMVYNLGTRSWTSRQVKRSSIDNVTYLSQNSCSVNFESCVYWLAKSEIRAIDTHYLCFNLSSEALTCSKLPDAKHLGRRRLSVLYDSLALVDSFIYTSYRRIHVWIRRKNSSTKTSSVFTWAELYNVVCYDRYFLYLMNNGNLYLRSCALPMTTFVYDLKTRKEKVCSETQGNINFMDGYLESLALLR